MLVVTVLPVLHCVLCTESKPKQKEDTWCLLPSEKFKQTHLICHLLVRCIWCLICVFLPALASFLHSRLIHQPVAPCRMMSCNSSWNVWTTSEAEMLQNMYWSLLVNPFHHEAVNQDLWWVYKYIYICVRIYMYSRVCFRFSGLVYSHFQLVQSPASPSPWLPSLGVEKKTCWTFRPDTRHAGLPGPGFTLTQACCKEAAWQEGEEKGEDLQENSTFLAVSMQVSSRYILQYLYVCCDPL